MTITLAILAVIFLTGGMAAMLNGHKEVGWAAASVAISACVLAVVADAMQRA
jgi:hypothetical protein